jgi:apolipoprotein N-acyltransferase
MRILAWIALVPLFIVLRRVGVRSALLFAWAFTVAVAYATGDWFPRAVATYYDQPAVVGVGFFFGVSSIMAAPYVMAFTVCYRWLSRSQGPAHVLLAAAAWVAAELCRARLLGGNPWVLLGYSQAGVEPLVQIADITGVYGVSFVLVAANAALAEVCLAATGAGRSMPAAVRGLVLACVAAVGVITYGQLRLNGAAVAPANSPPIQVAVVQGNLDLGSQWRKEFYGRNLDIYLRLTQAAIGGGTPALVIWPENAMSFFVDREPLYREAIGAVLGPAHAQLVAGGPRFVSHPPDRLYYNSAFLIASDGSVVAHYDKQRLLPFAENFPFASMNFLRRSFGKVREFTPGAPTPPLPTAAGAAGVVICNEAMFPEFVNDRVRSGADYVVNLSNDSWLDDAKFAAIVSDMVSFRAIEQRRYLVRASTAGPSTIIDPLGRVTARAEFPSRAVITGTVRPSTTATLYSRIGDTFAGLCTAAVIAAVLAKFVQSESPPQAGPLRA